MGTGNGLDQAGLFAHEGSPAHNLFGHFYKSEIHQKHEKSRHSATHWKQGVTVYLFFKCFPFFSFFLTVFFKVFNAAAMCTVAKIKIKVKSWYCDLQLKTKMKIKTNKKSYHTVSSQ